jgi:hypothetical protein
MAPFIARAPLSAIDLTDPYQTHAHFAMGFV